MSKSLPRLRFILATILFSTNPIFLRYTNLPPEVVVLFRGFFGACIILLLFLFTKTHPDYIAIKRNIHLLILSGICMGLNWITLFSAYNYTTVSIASIISFTAPVIIIAASPWVLKTRLTVKQVLLLMVAFLGVILVSDVAGIGSLEINPIGVLLALGAAVSGSVMILANKKIKHPLGSFDSALIQLLFAFVTILIFVVIRHGHVPMPQSIPSFSALMYLGVVNTGIAYILYYGALAKLPVTTVSIMGYFEPVCSVAISVLILKEPFGSTTAIGGILIIIALVLNEFGNKK